VRNYLDGCGRCLGAMKEQDPPVDDIASMRKGCSMTPFTAVLEKVKELDPGISCTCSPVRGKMKGPIPVRWSDSRGVGKTSLAKSSGQEAKGVNMVRTEAWAAWADEVGDPASPQDTIRLAARRSGNDEEGKSSNTLFLLDEIDQAGRGAIARHVLPPLEVLTRANANFNDHLTWRSSFDIRTG